jgi:hypothetical protein
MLHCGKKLTRQAIAIAKPANFDARQAGLHRAPNPGVRTAVPVARRTRATPRCNKPAAGATFPPEMLASYPVFRFNQSKLC